MAYVYIETDTFSDDDLIEELESRGYVVTEEGAVSTPLPTDDYNELLLVIYELYRNGKNYDTELRQMFYDRLGRIC